MKKIILLIFIIIALLSAGCGIYDLTDFVLPDDVEFMEVINALDTPEKISEYMLENFIYEAHDFYAPDPYTLWKTGLGDCNDFACFGTFIADYHGYETYQIRIFLKNTIFKHRVAVYNEDIWYSITDNQYYYFGFHDFKEIVNYVCDKRFIGWSKYVVYDYWNDIIETGYNN